MLFTLATKTLVLKMLTILNESETTPYTNMMSQPKL